MSRSNVDYKIDPTIDGNAANELHTISPTRSLNAGYDGKFDRPVPGLAVTPTGQCGKAQQRSPQKKGNFYKIAMDVCRQFVVTSDKPIHVVEIGCGAANLSADMAEAGAMVTSIDCRDNFGENARRFVCLAGERHKPGKIRKVITSVEKADHGDVPWTAKLFVAERFGHWLHDHDLRTVVKTMTKRAADGAVAMFSLASFECDFVQNRFYMKPEQRTNGIISYVKTPVTPATPIHLRHVGAEPADNSRSAHYMGHKATPRTLKEARALFEDRGWTVNSIEYSPTRLLEVICTLERRQGSASGQIIDFNSRRRFGCPKVI